MSFTALALIVGAAFMLIGAFFGAKLLREGNVRQRIIGSIFMVAGITGLALA